MLRSAILGLGLGFVSVNVLAETPGPVSDPFAGVEIWACHDQDRNEIGLVALRQLDGRIEALGDLSDAMVTERRDTVRVSTEQMVLEIRMVGGSGGGLRNGIAFSIECEPVTGEVESIIYDLFLR